MSRFAVTRTVEKTEVTCLCFDKTIAEPFNRTVTIAGNIKDPKALERKVIKAIEADENIRFIEICEINVISGVYGITEEAFFNNAVELDPKTRKPLK